MASKAKTLQVKDKEKDDKAQDAPEKDSADAPSPLLDLSDAAVKKMIKQAKKRGFVTFDQLNEVLPSDTTSPEQIEDIMSMLSDMGINVTEAEDTDGDDEKEEAGGRHRQRARRGHAEGRHRGQEIRAGRAHRRSRADVSARDGHGRTAVPRGRNRHRQAHRGRPRGDDRRALRKPADLPGHHHLARRVERRQDLPSRHHRSRSHLCRPRRQEQHEPAADGPGRSRRPAGGRRQWRSRARRQAAPAHVAPPAAPPAPTPFRPAAPAARR